MDVEVSAVPFTYYGKSGALVYLRDNTERPETVTTGTNELIGTNPAALKPALDKLFAGKWKSGGIPEKWDGKTGERIVAILDQLLTGQKGATN